MPGVCPQFDLLWPDLTVKEHLQLYARIKGVTSRDLQIASSASEARGCDPRVYGGFMATIYSHLLSSL